MTQPSGDINHIDKRPRKTDRRQGLACHECKSKRQRCQRTSLQEVCFSCNTKGLPCDITAPPPPSSPPTKKRKASTRQPAWKKVRDSFGLIITTHVSPTATPAKLFNSELAASMSTHLLTLFLAVKGDVPMLHWKAFEHQVDKADRRASLLSESAQVLSAVVEALGARISDHSHIVGSSAPVLLDLSTYRVAGHDISQYGQMRKSIYERLLHRAIKLADDFAIYRKPSSYSVAAFMLLDWLTSECSNVMDSNPNHTFGRLALTHIGTIVQNLEQDPELFRYQSNRDLKPETWLPDGTLVDLKMMGGLAYTYESLTVARTGDEHFIRDFAVCRDMEHYTYDVDARALIGAKGIDRVKLVATVQPLLYARVAELNRMCGKDIVKPYLSGKEVNTEAVEDLFDLLEEYHQTLGMFSARLISLPQLGQMTEPTIKSLRRACDHWITYDIFGAANVTFLMYETLIRSASVSGDIAFRCYQAMYHACRVVVARVKMEVQSDPIKAMEPGKAYDDLDLIADFLDGLKLEDEGGPPGFTAEKRMDDLETLERALQYRGWSVAGLKPRIDRVTAYIKKYSPALEERPSSVQRELSSVQILPDHSNTTQHAGDAVGAHHVHAGMAMDVLASAASDRAFPTVLRQAPVKTPSETSSTSSTAPGPLQAGVSTFDVVGKPFTLTASQQPIYPARHGMHLPPHPSSILSVCTPASGSATTQYAPPGPSHPYFAPRQAGPNMQSGMLVPSTGRYISYHEPHPFSGPTHVYQAAPQQPMRYYSYEAAEEVPLQIGSRVPAPTYVTALAAQGYEEVSSHYAPDLPPHQQPIFPESEGEAARNCARPTILADGPVTRAGADYMSYNGSSGNDARYQDFAVRHILERNAGYNGAE